MAVGKRKFESVMKAIQDVESKTSGEVRVHITRKFFENNPMERATRLFHQLGMTRTQHRNGVLLYVNRLRHRFAVYGDIGIHKTVGQHYWDQLAAQVSQDLKTKNFTTALVLAVQSIGKTLSDHFPPDSTKPDRNELSDEITED